MTPPKPQRRRASDEQTPTRASRPGCALLLGALTVAALCAVTPYNDLRLKNTFLYGNHLPVGGLFALTILVLAVNPVARRVRPSWALTPGEVLLVWVMVTAGAGLASSGLWRYLAPMAVAPAYFAESGRRWLGLFEGSPRWLLATSEPGSPVARWFYHGLPPGEAIPWAAWIAPTIAWGTAFGCVAMLSLGLAGLFRAQWVNRERLAFPLAQLPVQLAYEAASGGDLFRRRAFWAGCAVVVGLHALSTLHQFVPSVPDAANRFDISAFQQNPPWDALGIPTLEVFWAVIAAVYLLPSDVSFTLWSTYVGLHLFRVVRASLGYEPVMPGPLNHEGALGVGAVLVWAAWLVWSARPHWRDLLRAARTGQCTAADDPLGPRKALALTFVGVAGLAVFMHLAGLPWVLAGLLTFLFCLTLLVITRMVAEAGLLFVQTPFIPTDMMAFWGTGYYTPAAAGTSLLTEVILMHDPREHVMPAIANAYALPSHGAVAARWVTPAVAAAIVVGFLVSAVASLWVNYRFGAITLDQYGPVGAPTWSLDRALQYVDSPLQANVGDLRAMGLGAALAAALVQMKVRFLWWPFGPIGLVMGSTYAMYRIWFSVLVGWACKAGIVRLAGLPGYRVALPFFLGLLFGEGAFAGAAALWGMATGVTAPQFLPN